MSPRSSKVNYSSLYVHAKLHQFLISSFFRFSIFAIMNHEQGQALFIYDHSPDMVQQI